MRNLLRLVFAGVIFAISSSVFAAETKTSFSKKQVLADINQLVGLLKKNHPNLYAHRGPKKFKSTVKKVKSQVTEKMSRLDAAIQFQKILASVCDEHTRIRFSPKNELATYENARYLESSLILRKGRVVVGNSRWSTNSSVVLKIGKYSADEITDYLQSLQNNDGCIDKKVHVIEGANFRDMIFLGNLYKNKKVPLFIEFRKGRNSVKKLIRTANISETANTVVSNRQSELRSVVTRLGYEGFEYESNKIIADFVNQKTAAYLFINSKTNVYYLRVNTFLGGKKWTKEIDRKLRKIISDNPSHLIIDLTNNPGGQLIKAGEFLSFLLPKAHRPARYVRVKNPRRRLSKSIVWKSKKRKKNLISSLRQFRKTRRRNGQYRLQYRRKSFGHPDYKGKLTVLVSPNTHSAATTVAMILKAKRKAKIVGYSNGSSMKTGCFAPAGSHKLKHTQILVDIPFTCFDRDLLKSTDNGKLNPDIVVNPMVLNSSSLSGEIVRAALKAIRGEK